MEAADKLVALNRSCNASGVQGDVSKLIKWFGAQTIAEANFRTSHRTICKACFQLPDTKENINRIKTVVSQTRILLNDLSRELIAGGDVWIDLPKSPPRVPAHLARMGRLALTFNDGSSSPAVEGQKGEVEGTGQALDHDGSRYSPY